MIQKLKKILYFPIAYYFRFFSKIRLLIWKPRIIVVTGSSGKTSLLHFIESQLQNRARYSHQANSSYGIPFDILGLKRKSLIPEEWLYLFVSSPFGAFKKPPKEKIYVVEADCDRPNEGKFLATLLKPQVTLWTGAGRSHSANFDSVVKKVEKAIAHEFGYFLEETKALAIVNSDNNLIKNQLKRTKALVKTVTQKQLNSHKIFKNHTEFKIDGKTYKFKYLLPKEFFYSIQMTNILLDYLKVKHDFSFSKFSLPPGRCSLFKGIKNTTLIDSSYNATPDSMRAVLQMFIDYPSDKKWLVLGDMVELGNEEKEEHEKLADIIHSMKLDEIILVGPRLLKYTYPKLKTMKQLNNETIKTFLMPKDALDYLVNNLKGGEVMLFKGARFLEGVIEHLLADRKDINKLCRRESIWQQRRKKWGL